MEASESPGAGLEPARTPSTLELAFTTAFARGDFAAVKTKAETVLGATDTTAEDRGTAAAWLARTRPPSAARFALWATLGLVLTLSVYFAFLKPHP